MFSDLLQTNLTFNIVINDFPSLLATGFDTMQAHLYFGNDLCNSLFIVYWLYGAYKNPPHQFADDYRYQRYVLHRNVQIS